MQSVIQYIKEELSGLYPTEEIRAFTRLIFENICGLNYTQTLIRRNIILNPSEKRAIQKIVERLKTFEPIQYILGKTEFYGLELKVKSGVLIPRPETEELVQWIIDNNSVESPSVLDIGTGSGCIALAIKKELPTADVAGFDISEEALEIARKNAETNNLSVNFFYANILICEQQSWGKYDIIVSNPPYVRELEKINMDASVLKFEPQVALFVPDSDPLVYYRQIGNFALKNLQKNGHLFFEINERFGNQILTLLSELGFKNLQIRKDIHEKERMLFCQLLE